MIKAHLENILNLKSWKTLTSLLLSDLNFVFLILKNYFSRTLSSKKSILNVQYVKQMKAELFQVKEEMGGKMVRVWSSGRLSITSLSRQLVGSMEPACPSFTGESLFNFCLITSNDKKLIGSQGHLFYFSSLHTSEILI